MSNSSSRWRLFAGVACFVAAAVVGLVGYLQLSVETAIENQLPYLASAGMSLVLLSAVGVALVVCDQLRTDDAHVEELTAAIQQLADAVAPEIERPARRRPPDGS